MSARYMLDTNVFNHVLDGRLDATLLEGRSLFVTHIQHDEIQSTKDESRRGALMKIFDNVLQVQAPTSTMVAGVSVAGGACASAEGVLATESNVGGISRWGQAKWGTKDNIFEDMRRDLDALNKGKKNNAQDILIAETALRNKLVLVTSDVDLFQIMSKYGGACANLFLLEVG
jgi:predicted nucleic acid-binding protein